MPPKVSQPKPGAWASGDPTSWSRPDAVPVECTISKARKAEALKKTSSPKPYASAWSNAAKVVQQSDHEAAAAHDAKKAEIEEKGTVVQGPEIKETWIDTSKESGAGAGSAAPTVKESIPPRLRHLEKIPPAAAKPAGYVPPHMRGRPAPASDRDLLGDGAMGELRER